MARAAGVAPQQLRALGRLKSVRGIDRFYLAGGAAIAFHLEHRRSNDLDLFGPVAGLVDLATNKLAAISKRGLKRDFWDLYAILQSGLSLSEACRAYVKRFGVAESDLYHVTTGLTWFEEAEAEAVPPAGMTKALWKKIRACFEAEVPRLVLTGRR